MPLGLQRVHQEMGLERKVQLMVQRRVPGAGVRN